MVGALTMVVPVLGEGMWGTALAATSTIETQRSMQNFQRNWAAVESSKSELDAINGQSKAELKDISNEIQAVQGTLLNAMPGSAEQLEAQTRMTELLAKKYINQYKRDEACKRICAEILGKIMDIEDDMDTLSKAYAEKNSDEMRQFKNRMLKSVQQVVQDSALESVNLGKSLDAKADPALRSWVKNSDRYWATTARIVQSQLARRARVQNNPFATHKINARNFRSMIETLQAQLRANEEHNKQMLSILKANAEFQGAAIVSRQMNKTMGDMFVNIDQDYDSTGVNTRYEEDWQQVKLTEPSMDFFDN